MGKKEKKVKRISLKMILIPIVMIEIVIIFFCFFFSMTDREIPALINKVDNAVSKVENLAPTLVYNEKTMLGMYELWLISRYTFISDSIKENEINNREALMDHTEEIGISGAYYTDSLGRMIFSCGEEPVMELPYESDDPIYLVEDEENEEKDEQYVLDFVSEEKAGQDTPGPEGEKTQDDQKKSFVCYLGVTDDKAYYILGGKVADNRYLAVQIPRNDINRACLSTLSLRKQVNNIGRSLGLDALLLADDETYKAYEAFEGNEAYAADEGILHENEYTKTYYEQYDAYIYRRSDSASDFFLGKPMEIRGEKYLVAADLRSVLGVTILNVLQMTFIAAFFLVIFAVVIYDIAEKGFKERGEIRRSVAFFFCFCLITVAVFNTFMRDLCDTSSRFYDMEKQTGENVSCQEEYTKERNDLGNWLDEQFLYQSHMASERCSEDPEKLTRGELAEMADYMGIEYIYVLDKNGKTIVTNSPDADLALSKDDNTADFLPLLSGRKEIVQNPVMDERSGEMKQYIGVSMKDKDGICNGCILTTYTASRREALTSLLDPTTTLKYGLVGEDEQAFVIDRSNGQILGSDESGFIGLNIDQFYIPKAVTEASKIMEYKDDEILTVAGSEEYSNSENSGQLLVMVKDSEPRRYLIFAAVLEALMMLVSLSVILLAGLFGHGKKQEKGPEGTEETGTDMTKEDKAHRDIDSIVDSMESGNPADQILSLRAGKKFLFEERWNRKRKRRDEMSMPEYALYSLRTFAIIFAIISVLPYIMYVMGIDLFAGFSAVYVMSGKWKSGFNIFSAVHLLLIITIMVFLNLVIKEVLYQIARVSNTRIETICLLIKSSIKYIFMIIFIIIILSQIGISTTTLLASAGVLTMVIGIGAQSITSDLLSGLFLIFERAFDVGDTITVNGKTGVVTEIGLRTTRLTANGDLFVVNNTDVRSVINRSGDFTRINMEISVSAETDIKTVEEILQKNLPDIQNRVTGLVREPRYRGVSNITSSEMRLNFSLYTISYKRSEARMGFIRQMKMLFDENGIRMMGSTGSNASDDPGF